MEIKGEIERYSIGDKNFPVIWIDSNRYAIGEFGKRIAKSIEVGDSLCKEKNSYCPVLYKRDSDMNYSFYMDECE